MNQRKRRWPKIAATVVGALVLLLILDQWLIARGRHLSLSVSTTRLTSPVRSDSGIDYARVLDERAAQSATLNNNAVPLLLRALGPEVLGPYAASDVLSKLGMADLPTTGDYFISRDDWNDHQKPGKPRIASQELLDCARAPWAVSDHPLIAQWIDANQPAMAVLAQASRLSRCYTPMTSRGFLFIDGQTPWDTDIPEAFGARAMRNLAARRYAEFNEDIFVLLRLSRLLAQQSSLINAMLARDLSNVARIDTIAALADASFPRDQVHALAAQLEAESPLPEFASIMDERERYTVLDMAATAARIGPWRLKDYLERVSGPDPLQVRFSQFWFIPINFDTVLQEINNRQDQLVAALRIPNYHDRVKALGDWHDQMERVRTAPTGSPSRNFSRVFLLFLAGDERLAVVETRSLAYTIVSRTGCAIYLFREQNKRLPSSLQELIPSFLQEVPIDPYSGHPLHYLVTATDALAYCIGENE